MENFDIFLVSEPNVDVTFPNVQFKINNFQIFRHDHNKFGGGLMFHLNENIPYKLFNNHSVDTNIVITVIGFHQIKQKRLLLKIYKPADQIDLDFINHKTQLALQTIKQTLLKIFQTFETGLSDYH